jgi:hypothetical protein
MTPTQKNIVTLVVLVAAVLAAKRGSLLAPAVVSPIAEPGLHVLIIEETSARTPELGSVIHSAQWQALVAPGNWRILDPVDDNGQPADLSQLEPKWRDAAARPRGALPWVIVSNAPYGGYAGPLVPSELVPLVETWAAKSPSIRTETVRP